MSKKIQAQRRQLLQRRLDRLQEIDARLRFVHPSGKVIILPWYPDPIWVPLRKEDDNRAIILNLNGLLCHVVETQEDTLYNNELVKHPINQYRYALCHQNAHEFLDWCIQFFHVFIWSTYRRTKIFQVIDKVFPRQKPKFAGILSQEDCSKSTWLVQGRQVFFKKLETFWDLYPLYNTNNTLIIDNSYYKVFENVPGTWLIVPELYHQHSKERCNFLKEHLRDWLFLWLQNENRRQYSCDNAFEETPNQFSDDVMEKWHEEAKAEIERRRNAEIRKQQEDADAEAERQEQCEWQRKKEEEAE